MKFKVFTFRVLVVLFIFLSTGYAQIKLNTDGYFEAPGFRFLVYQNETLGMRLGGLEMILHGRRVLDAGNVVCWSTEGEKYGYYTDNEKIRGDQIIDKETGHVRFTEEIKPLALKYNLVVNSDGKSIEIRVDLDRPVNWQKVSDIALRIEIYPEDYDYKTYTGGGISDYFYEQHMGRRVLIPEATEIQVASEDPLKHLTFEGENAILSLRDERRDFNIGGYMLFASLNKKSRDKSFSLKITPKIDPTWRKEPVLQLSQVGYTPDQKKIAVLEMDPRVAVKSDVQLYILDENSGLKLVKEGKPQKWGELFSNTCYTYDFSDIKASGQYFLKYENQQVGPFKISPDVFRTAWQTTMDMYFPTQMCHVKVRDFLKIWHGACHVEDALQAPPSQIGKDGYRQGPETETRFQANEHIPGINWGGWHDAADFDIPSGSNCETLRWMALAQEEFQTSRDVTTVLRDKRLVELFMPDGKNDMLQQIAFGMEWLLSMLREIGHIPAGVIANNGPDYGANGDPTSITDGLFFDPKLEKNERKNGYSGKFDDRWVFTNRNTGGQYQFVQIASLCSRVFRNNNDKLASECLQAAEKVWTCEQSHEPKQFQVAYQPQEDKYHSLEIGAAAELFLTTAKEEYRQKLVNYIPTIQDMPVSTFKRIGFILVRAHEKVKDVAFSNTIFEKAKVVKEQLKTELEKTPYNVELVLGWGSNWEMLTSTAKLYYFIKEYPELFDPEILYSTVHFVLGFHPASNHSFVSGIGAKSATVVYGFNRWDKSYQPGGVISGVSLIKPDMVEYRGRAWDYYQTEHVIAGSAAYVFDVLAADFLLNNK